LVRRPSCLGDQRIAVRDELAFHLVADVLDRVRDLEVDGGAD
jgi:hypothetical protein